VVGWGLGDTSDIQGRLQPGDSFECALGHQAQGSQRAIGVERGFGGTWEVTLLMLINNALLQGS
jgi:hypothetical protein